MRQALVLGVMLLVLGVGSAVAGNKAKTVNGRVTAVTSDTITIAQGMGALTIVCDATTQIKRKAQTSATQAANSAATPSLQDSIGVGDNVTVTYSEAGGTLHASVVKLTYKAR